MSVFNNFWQLLDYLERHNDKIILLQENCLRRWFRYGKINFACVFQPHLPAFCIYEALVNTITAKRSLNNCSLQFLLSSMYVVNKVVMF